MMSYVLLACSRWRATSSDASALDARRVTSTATRAIGARARQRIVDRYDIQRTAGQWLDAYHTVLAGKR